MAKKVACKYCPVVLTFTKQASVSVLVHLFLHLKLPRGHETTKKQTMKIKYTTLLDGDGYSLVLINPSSNPDHSNPSNWRCSVQNHGNPGASDSLPAFSGNANTDNDLDGLPALVEHLLGGSDNDGTDAQNLLSSGLIEITDQTTTRHLTLTFRRTLGADDLTPVVEVSPTM